MKKVSLSTILFWLGWFITALAAFLAWKFPSDLLVLFLIALCGLALTGWQKIVGDREQDKRFEQEHKARVAAEQRVWSDTPSGRTFGALSQHASMHKDSQK